MAKLTVRLITGLLLATCVWSQTAGENANNASTTRIAGSNPQRFAGTWKEDMSKTVNPVDPQSTLDYRQNIDESLTQTQIFGPGNKRERTIWVDGKPRTLKNTTWVDGKSEVSKIDPGLTETWIKKGPSAWEQKIFRDGKLPLVLLREIGPDTQTMSETETDYNANGTSSQGITVYQRTTNTSGLLGTWKPVSTRGVTPDVIEMSFGSDGTMNWHGFALDFRYSAKFDGNDYKVTGPDVNPNLREELIKIDDNAIEDISKDGKKPFQVGISRLSPDGNTIWVTYVDLLSSTPLVRSFVYRRQ